MRPSTPWPPIRPSPRLPPLALALLLLTPPFAAGCRTAAVADPATPVGEVGDRLERRIAAAERQAFTLDLEAGRFVHLVIAERGADVVATLTGPSGELLAAADGPRGGGAQELLAAVTRESGRHRVSIELRPGAPAGAYQLRYLNLRDAEPTDGELIEGMRAYLAGKALNSWDATPDDQARALAALERAARHFERAGDDNFLGWTLALSAEISAEGGEPQAAEGFARRAAGLFAGLGEDGESGRASALTALALALTDQGRSGEASAVFDEVLGLDMPQHTRAVNLHNRGYLLLQTGSLSEAEESFRQALGIWRQDEGATSKRWQVRALINLGVAQRQSGDLVAAFHGYEEAAALSERFGTRQNRVHLAANLGRYYIATGELQKALETLTRGLDAARELGNAKMQSAISSNLGFVYRLLGQPGIARSYQEQALTLVPSTDDPRNFALRLAALGRLNGELGEEGTAREQLTRAVDLARQADSAGTQVRALTELGRFETSVGNPEIGLQLIRRSERLTDDSHPSVVASLRHAEAVALQQLGNTDEALQVLRSALDPALSIDDPLILGSIHALLGELERSHGDLGTALEHLEKAVSFHELIRSRIVDPWQRATFVAHRYEHFQALIDLLMELDSHRPGEGYAERAFQTSERLRARSLVELLAEAHVEVRRNVSAELRRREKDLALRIALLQSELLSAAGEDAETVGSADLRRALETAMLEQEHLTLEIRSSWDAYASLRYPEPLQLEEIQRSLAVREALMHYSLGPDRSFLFVVRRDGFAAHELPPAPEIDAAVESIRNDLVAADPRSMQRALATGRTLSRLLFGPALHELSALDRLAIVPDGSLFLLPFEVLGTADGLLLDRLTITYVPSANVIGLLPSTGEHGKTFVAFAGVTGDPVARPGDTRNGALRSLPGTVDEVEAIARLVPDGTHLYLGLDAHQGNLFDNPEVTHAQWLHFASHALRLEGGFESAILLSPDSHGDRLLQISEVFNLDLNAEVVVLSACETALGQSLRGDGMVGLARAFFYAGSPNLVVSLWPVDDRATARFMELFYAHLAGGLAPGDSLRQAKLDLIRTTPYRSPRFWAPFILMAAPRGEAVTAAADGTPVALSAIRTIELKEGER